MRQIAQAIAVVAGLMVIMVGGSYVLRQPAAPTPIPNIIIDQPDNGELATCQSEVARLDAKLAEHRAYVAAMKVWLADRGYQVSATGEITETEDAASRNSVAESEGSGMTPTYTRRRTRWRTN